MQLNDNDRIAAGASAEAEPDKQEKNEELFHEKQSLKSIQDAETGHPTRPQGESVAEACSVLHIEADDRPTTKLEAHSASCLAVVGELQIDAKILPLQKRDRGLQIILALTDHPHLFTLDLRLHLQFGFFHGLRDFLGLLR